MQSPDKHHSDTRTRYGQASYFVLYRKTVIFFLELELEKEKFKKQWTNIKKKFHDEITKWIKFLPQMS